MAFLDSELIQDAVIRNIEIIGEASRNINKHYPELLAGRVAEDLVTQLDLPINMMLEKESAFFKHHYRSNWYNRGVMIKEIDVIRTQEGW